MTKESHRLGIDLAGNGKASEHHPYPPNIHGRGRTRDSECSLQLREKQKARFAYDVLEEQSRRYYEEMNYHPGKAGDTLLQILESHLDNVVCHAGFAATRRQARQLMVHGHFLASGEKVSIPSYRVKAHDIIDVVGKSMNPHPLVVAHEIHRERVVPAWLETRPNRMRILIHQLPIHEQIVIDVQEQMIIELCSK